MSESLFEFVASELQKRSGLENLEARGTLRLALKSSGLTAREVTPLQMTVVLNQVMPRELKMPGIENPEAVCEELSQAVKGIKTEGGESAGTSPEDVFRRLSEAEPPAQSPLRHTPSTKIHCQRDFGSRPADLVARMRSAHPTSARSAGLRIHSEAFGSRWKTRERETKRRRQRTTPS